jgi:hypothetical protein
MGGTSSEYIAFHFDNVLIDKVFPYWTRFIKVSNFGGLGTSYGLWTFQLTFGILYSKSMPCDLNDLH